METLVKISELVTNDQTLSPDAARALVAIMIAAYTAVIAGKTKV